MTAAIVEMPHSPITLPPTIGNLAAVDDPLPARVEWPAEDASPSHDVFEELADRLEEAAVEMGIGEE